MTMVRRSRIPGFFQDRKCQMYINEPALLHSIKILHILHYDIKFTVGYVNFMKIKMTEWDHTFIIAKADGKVECVNNDNVYIVNNFYEMIKRRQLKEVIKNANIIIISGVFSSYTAVSLFKKKDLNKIFLHFWGADFYDLREQSKSIREKIKNMLKVYCCHKCAGLIFLIEGEYDKFREIVHVEKNYFIAPMPGDPLVRINYADYRKRSKSTDPVRVLVGNSATETNHHKEIIDWIANYIDRDIEVYAPLSYGDELYRNEILKYGAEKLGKKFFPVLNFMDLYSYMEFLSSMDIGIFNNDRQQAMGNINRMIAIGKKIYLRKDTSMWNRFTNDGYIVFPIRDVEAISYGEFICFDARSAENNERIYDAKDKTQEAINRWQIIFEKLERGGVN